MVKIESNKVYNVNCIDGMKLMDKNSVDSIITDPPYFLGFMGKDWDKSGDVTYQEFTERWATEAFRILKPNGIKATISVDWL